MSPILQERRCGAGQPDRIYMRRHRSGGTLSYLNPNGNENDHYYIKRIVVAARRDGRKSSKIVSISMANGWMKTMRSTNIDDVGVADEEA